MKRNNILSLKFIVSYWNDKETEFSVQMDEDTPLRISDERLELNYVLGDQDMKSWFNENWRINLMSEQL